jgi:hypothetical protein
MRSYAGDDVWIPRIGPKATLERRIGNRVIFAGLLLAAGIVLLLLLKVAHLLPQELIQAGKTYMLVFGIYGALMAPCGWLPMYFLAGRSAARFLGATRTARKRIPVAWLRDPALFDRLVHSESEGGGDALPYPKIADPRHDALVAQIKRKQEQRRRDGSQ